MKKVVVAMSGGVDSSVAAALLKEQGYDVYGITMRLANWQESEGRKFGGCCGSSDFYDARSVAQSLGIPHYSYDYVDKFRGSVIGYFKDSYLHGETPNPCIACNQHIKFDALLNQAMALGADFLATGHYARIEKVSDKWQVTSGKVRKDVDSSCHLPPATCHYALKRAIDPSKDQSYVLYHLGQKELSQLLFPLGGFTKTEIREMARKYGLKIADKPDSQEICFVPNQDYRQFIEEEVPADQRRPGPIRHRDGRVLGQHRGLPFYTVGQREGLGLSVGHPLYVTEIDTTGNALVVGDKADVFAESMTVRDLAWVAGKPPSLPSPASVKIRYKHKEAAAVLIDGAMGPESEDKSSVGADLRSARTSPARPLAGPAIHVSFKEPQSAITPGQSAVFYEGDRVLGGGIIDHAS